MGIFSSSLITEEIADQYVGSEPEVEPEVEPDALTILERQLEFHNTLLVSAQAKNQRSIALAHFATIERLITQICAHGESPTAKRNRVDEDYIGDSEDSDSDDGDSDAGDSDDGDSEDCDSEDGDSEDGDSDNLKADNHYPPWKRIKRGSGRLGEQNGVHFDQYERDPREGDWMSANNAALWHSEENGYKDVRRGDRRREAENGHGFTLDEFVVADDDVDFDDSLDDESEIDADDESVKSDDDF